MTSSFDTSGARHGVEHGCIQRYSEPRELSGAPLDVKTSGNLMVVARKKCLTFGQKIGQGIVKTGGSL
jgi:hypothetical protein